MSPYTWINGEELIYTADDESLIRLNAVKKILKIVGEGCVFPNLLSPDGRNVLCQDRRGRPPHRISLYDVGAEKIIDIYRSFLPLDFLLLWDMDGKSLIFSKELMQCSLKICADYLLSRQILQTAFLSERFQVSRAGLMEL